MGHNHAQPKTWPLDEVAEALERRLEMNEDDALATAEQLHEIFGDETVIEDTEVENDERAFLWSLLLEGVVTCETQHRPHPDHGRMWRYFYWHLVPPERLSTRGEEEAKEPTVYDELPPDAWRRTAAA